MAGISKLLNVKVIANINGFMSGMSKASRAVGKLGADVGGMVAKIGGFGAALATLAAGAGFTALLSGALQSVDATNKLARQLGVSAESLSRLQYAASYAGVSTEALATGIKQMHKSLAEPGAEKTFAKLGLSIENLKAMQPDMAFLAIGEAIQNIENPTQRVTALLDIFGKQGLVLQGLFESGTEGLKGFFAEADKLGYSFNGIDGMKVEMANDAIQKIRNTLQGAATVLAVQLAPFLTAFALKIASVGTSGEGMGQKVLAAFGWVVKAIAKVADLLEYLKGGWAAFKNVGVAAIYALLIPVATLIKSLDWLYQKISGKGPSQMAAAVDGMMANLQQQMATNGQEAASAFLRGWEGENSKKAAEWMKGIQEASQKAATAAQQTKKDAPIDTDALEASLALTEKITASIAELHSQVDTLGMSEEDKKIFDLAAMGASDADIAKAQELVAIIEQFKAQEEAAKKADEANKKAAESLKQRADALKESIATPLEQYEKKIGEFDELLKAGAISYDEYSKAVGKAHKELNKPKDVQSPDLMGRVDTQRFSAQLRFGQATKDKDDLLEEQVDLQKAMEKHLRDMANRKPNDDIDF